MVVLDEVLLRAVAKQVPEFFGDERSDWVKEQEELAQDEVLNRKAVVNEGRIFEASLGGFDVPVTEVAPEERVQSLRVGGELVFVEVLGRAIGQFGESLQDGEVVIVELRGLDAADHGGER